MKSNQFNKTVIARTGKGILDLVKPNTPVQSGLDMESITVESKFLFSVWQSLLGHSGFYEKDDFFQVGGDSLKAVQLVSRISNHFLIKIGLTDIFLNPTIAQQVKLIGESNHELSIPPLKSFNRPSIIPLSFSQERLWFIDQLEGSLQYHIPAVIRMTGDLNQEALRRSLSEIVDRHEVLRSVFYQDEEGKIYQRVKEKGEWKLDIALGYFPKEDTIVLNQYIRQLVEKPFDLSKDDMIRATLLSIGEEEHLLVITMHHIASDGWSMSILVKEVISLYNSFSANKPIELKPLEIQYADYSIWQRDYLQEDVLEEKINYWKNKLDNVSALHLPTDYPRPSVQSTRGASKTFHLPKELASSLNQLSRQEGATLFMVLLAGFKILLHKYSGQEDICVGTPVANRTQQETEELIGFFVNTLALRSQVAGSSSFKELLEEMKATTLDAYVHQDVPFEKVVEAVAKERDPSRSPLFQVVLVLQNTPDIPELELGGLRLIEEPLPVHTSKFELTFTVTETDKGLSCVADYNIDLYKEETIERMISHYKKLLQSIVASPAEKVSQLEMLTQEEEHQLLEEFNSTGISYQKDKNIIDLFEAQVVKTPNKVAVVFEEENITYEELNERANQLAGYLQKKGVKQESLVPICVERSTEMIIGILGILKAGGAYVPIDPLYPEDRINYMLEDTEAGVIISDKSSRKKLDVKNQAAIITIDDEWEEITKETTENRGIKISPDNLAYIIYTSGSTGKPKGVMIEHRNVVRLFETEKPLFDFNEKDVWTMFHSFCFDFSVWEMYGALLYGGRLVVVPANVTKDTSLFSELLLKEKVTILNQTPSAFYVLQEMLTAQAEETDIRYVIFGGEALDPSKLRPWKNKYSNGRLINMYGITETTVHVTYQEIGWPQIEKGTSVIGKPIPTLSAYILGKEQNLLPIGVAGELCIGGAGVARGYLNRKELTAEKFIKDPFSHEEGSRMYRSGDLGRWQADGTIEYLGRIDDQVKIRGYRIELGEIENAIQQSGKVNQAVVLAKSNKEGSKYLVAYIVAKDIFGKEALTTYLHSKLPEYMVPAIWVELAIIPLTSNGKVDKKSLPDPGLNELLSNEYTAPRNELEEQLAATWQDLLGIEKVGINDNFFELGGDSILTIQVVSRIRKAGYELQPKDLFINQTIARLSAVMAERSEVIISGEQGPLAGHAGLLPIQQWFLEKQSAGISHYNQSVLLKIDKSIKEPILNKAIEHLSHHHDALRFQYVKEKNKWEQEYSQAIPGVIVETIDSGSNGQQPFLITAICNKYQQSLNIEEGGLMQAVLIETADTETQNRLFIVVHHLAIDGVSWRILIEDLELLLNNIISGNDTSLGYKTSSYRQWYNALEKYSQSETLLSQRKYWQKAVAERSSLIADKQYKGSIKVGDTAQLNQKLGVGQTTSLIKDVSRVYHTEINDLLLGALAKTIFDWNKKQKIVIGLEGHGREEISNEMDISRTVGWFTTLYPVLLEIDQSDSNNPGNLIKTVKEQLRQVPGKGIGYGVLKYINTEESLQDNQPLEIVFNYFGQVDNVVRESKWFGIAAESTGESQNAEIIVGEKLSINSIITNNELSVNWTYSTKHFEAETINRLASNYIANLELLISHCFDQQKKGEIYTPSDYGLGAAIDYKELDNFLDEKTSGGKLRREEIEGLYLLSSLQQGMLFHNLYDGEAAAYTIQLSLVFTNVNVEYLLQSWNVVVKNHSILRTAFFHDKFNVPIQCVYKEVALPFESLDYRYMSEAERSAAVKAYEEAEREKGFDFTKAPLMRITLVRLSENSYWMLWTYHHIILDGWSLPILMEEFLSNYKSLVLGEELKTREADNFENYIRYIERKSEEDQKAYWKAYLKDLETPSLLPFIENSIERNRGAGEYKSSYWEIDTDKTDLIKNYAQRHRITVNTLVQGVWSYLLHSYTGADDVVFGVTVSGRPDDLPGVEHGVGLYINPLPLHAKITKDETVDEWLKALQKEQVASREFQNTPLSKIQEWSAIAGELFDCLLTFENYPVNKLLTSHDWGLQIEDVQTYDKNNYPLTIIVSLTEKLSVRFSYNQTLLGEEYMSSIIAHFENVLLQFISNAGSKLKDINLLTPGEQTKLLSYSYKEVFYPKQSSVVSLFEAQVEKTPDAIAVVFEDEKYTYAELNAKSNQLANYLKSKGVKEDTLVPLFIERSAQMLTGIMGILKAGGAYVPIDTEFPAERISFMLEDTNAKIIVSSAESIEKLGETEIETITIDDIFSPVNTQPKTNPGTAPSPENLAYVIYTSGSTGNPKGVMVEHRNLVDYVYGLKDTTQIDQCKSFALVSTIATDLGNTVLFSSLLFGGALHVFTKEAVSNIYGLHEYFEEHAIECLKIVPSHWKALSKEEELLLPSRLLVFGGEALHSEVALQIENTATSCLVVNHYGPTETTIGKLLNVVQKGKPYGKTIPIGKPFSNTKVYVLNKEMALCPAGVPGQLHIAGVGVARGYLNNDALTKSKFIKDPFEDGAVMYSTGDLVKYLPDGNIEFIGRVDNQVKIRGYRIELGEIENVLQQCELVSQAVVLATEDKQGNKRLLAYIVPQDEFDREGIYAYLKGKLPEYMMPAVIMEIATLPLMANGKVDRKALPDPEAGEVQSGVYVAPSNVVEKKLAEIWQEILEVDQVGIHDDFFELGGHSLLAIRLISMIRKELGLEVKIGDVFDYPTIALLSKRIAGQEDRVLLPTIEIKERPAKIPLSFSQERLWFIDQLEGSTQYHLPTILRLKGNLNVEALNYSLQQIVHRHQILRTVYKEEGGIPFQHIKEDEKNTVQEIDGSQFKDSSEELFTFIKQLVKTPFDLSKDNMLKVYLIEVAPEDHVLVAVMHHISSDAWSTSIMVKEVAELYNSFIEQRPPQLPAMDLQYADYSIWQRNNLKGEIFENKVAYWKEKLKGVAALELPTDYNRPPIISTKGSFVNFSIEKELSDEIKKLSQKESTTLFIVLQAIYKAMLYRYSGQQDISVGTSIARREQQQLESLIGFFVNTLALRDEVNGESTFMELLHQVKATTMEAYEHQEVPFEKVVEAVLKERDKSRSPLFQVMLVFINTPEVGELRLGGIELSAEEYEQTNVKFEITFFIRETANGFEGTVQYYTDLYKEETIKRMIVHFNELLKSVIKDPNEKIDLLQMLTEEEEQQLLMEFN